MKKFIFTFLLVSVSFFASSKTPLVLSDQLQELCICKDLVNYYEDTSGKQSLPEILKLARTASFKESAFEDYTNENTSSAYWISFELVNQTHKSFLIELFDYDLDEISMYIPDANNQSYRELKAGYAYPFHKRELNHKNVIFRIDLPKGAKATVFMRFKSDRHNNLEPILRSYDTFLNYGFTEYILFGLFYGLMLLMIFYNFLYFILLRKAHFFYYVLFGCGLLLYITAQNGTGFQFLWPNHPAFNSIASSLGLYVGIMAMLFFSYSFLELNKKGRWIKKIFLTSLLLRTIVFAVQIHYPDLFKWELVDILFIQLALAAGIYVRCYQPAKWYIVAYCLLNIFFLITGLENIGFLASSVFTVYATNIGIILNFVFLSIGIGESIQETYRLKNLADEKLILEYRKNDELKAKINRELEQLVKVRTLELESQNMEILNQKERIRAMNENLEEIVRNRTFQLEERNSRIQQYSFSNSHLVRAPLARILGLTYLAKVDKDNSDSILHMIENNAKELDVVIREMNRILDEN